MAINHFLTLKKLDMTVVLPLYLSLNQPAIWFDQHLFADKPIYNTGHALTIRGELRVDLFKRARKIPSTSSI